MNPFYRDTEIDFVEVLVSQQEVETIDITPALKTLQTLLYDAETVMAFRGKAMIEFDGYSNDSRELYEIPKVRQYLAELDSKFPYWFYFLSTRFDMLKMIAFCLCRARRIKTGMAHPDPDDFGEFLASHFDALNRLVDNFHLDEAINKEISRSIDEYFFPNA